MHRQLIRLHAGDVTWVLCAGREVVAALDAANRTCLHPCNEQNELSNQVRLHDGTISLALKHKLACLDMLRRGLASALVLEDDAMLPATMWESLAQMDIPRDADIFWVGSYASSAKGSFGTEQHPEAPGVRDAPARVHRRNSSRYPHALGAVGYVVFPVGAWISSSQPVTAPADYALSVFGRRRCASDLIDLYMLRAPPNQYGPASWLVWPVPDGKRPTGFGGGTHLMTDTERGRWGKIS